MFGVGLLISFCFVGATLAEGNVLDLTDASFDGELGGLETALVMFYAPWCGHCKKIKPEFEKSGGDLLRNDPPVTLAKVDCTEGGKEICNKFEVKGYPTLKIFRNGEFSADYNGPREAAGITKYMKAQVGPASKKLKDVADATKELAKGEVVVYYLGADDTEVGKTFAKVAAKMRENVNFANSADEAVAGAIGQPLDTVVLVRPKHLQSKLEDSQVVYSGAADKGELENWILANFHGLAGHRTPDNAKDFTGASVIAYYGVDYVKNVKGTNYWRNRVAKVCKEFDFKCGVSNKDDFQQELTEFGFEYVQGDKPVVAARDAKGLKFKMQDEFSVENFKTFMTLLEAGELDPWIKSEALPDNSANNVKVAVAKNFEELVTKNSKDVLVEFYAPWCGHCKKLTPIFEELGDKMAAEEVEIVKMDATANDVPPQFNVRGFPTLFWLPKNTKTPKTYEGGREVENFISYIAEYATDELNGWDRKGKVKKQDL